MPFTVDDCQLAAKLVGDFSGDLIRMLLSDPPAPP
jgi:hypothetical protein